MNQSELIDAVASQVGLSKTAAKNAVQAAFATIEGVLAEGGSVTLTGFGTFEAGTKQVPVGFSSTERREARVVRFRAGKGLKTRLGGE